MKKLLLTTLSLALLSTAHAGVYSGQCPLNDDDTFGIGASILDYVQTEQQAREQDVANQGQACRNFINQTSTNNDGLNANLQKIKDQLANAGKEEHPEGIDWSFRGQQVSCHNYGQWFQTTNSEFWNTFNMAHDRKGKFYMEHVGSRFGFFNSSDSNHAQNCISSYDADYETDKDKAMGDLTTCIQDRADEMLFQVELQCETQIAEYTAENRNARIEQTKNKWKNLGGAALGSVSTYLDKLTNSEFREQTKDCPAWNRTLNSLVNVAQEVSMLSANPLIAAGVQAGGAVLSSIFELFLKRGLKPGKDFLKGVEYKRHYKSTMCHMWEIDKVHCDFDQLSNLEARFQNGGMEKCTKASLKRSPLLPFMTDVNNLDKWLTEQLSDSNGDSRQVTLEDECFDVVKPSESAVDPFISDMAGLSEEGFNLLGPVNPDEETERDCDYNSPVSRKCTPKINRLAKRIKESLKKRTPSALPYAENMQEVINHIVIPELNSNGGINDSGWGDRTASEQLSHLIQKANDFDESASPKKQHQNAMDLIKSMNQFEEDFELGDSGHSLGDLFAKLKTDRGLMDAFGPIFNGAAGDNRADISRLKPNSTCAKQLVNYANQLVKGLEDTQDQLDRNFPEKKLTSFLKDYVAGHADPRFINDVTKKNLRDFADSVDKNRFSIKNATGDGIRQLASSANLIKSFLTISNDKSIEPMEDMSRFSTIIMRAKDKVDSPSIKSLYQMERTVQAAFSFDEHMMPFLGDEARRSKVGTDLTENKMGLFNFIKADKKVKKRLQDLEDMMKKALTGDSNAVRCKKRGIFRRKDCRLATSTEVQDQDLDNIFTNRLAGVIHQCLIFGNYWKEIDKSSYENTCGLFTCRSPKQDSRLMCIQQRNYAEITSQIVDSIVKNRKFPSCGSNKVVGAAASQQ